MKHFNLASERTRLGMTQEQLAETLDVSTPTIGRYEKFGDMPTDFIERAADFFGCSTDYLLDRTEDRLPRTKR